MDELESDEDFVDSFQEKKSSSKRTPKSAKKVKTVPYESVVIPTGDKSVIDKFLSFRLHQGQEELLIKYKNMGYIHSEWKSREEIEVDKPMKARVKRFLEKPVWDTQWSEDEPFNPAYNKVDRIIDEGEMESGKIFYLVKWCAQTYDLSTWESSDLIEKVCHIFSRILFNLIRLD